MHKMETETQTQVTKKFVSLAEKRPDLAKEWNYEKNGNLRYLPSHPCDFSHELDGSAF